MPKVLIRSTNNPKKTKRVDRRVAGLLVNRGGWVLEADAPKPTTDPRDLSELSYNELRKLARDQGLEGMGRKPREEIIAALSKPRRGEYRRRDLRAEDEE